MTAVGLYNYWIVVFLMMTGFYIVIAHDNLVKKIVGLNVFQASVFILYITFGKVQGGTAPIIAEGIPSTLIPCPMSLFLLLLWLASLRRRLASHWSSELMRHTEP